MSSLTAVTAVFGGENRTFDVAPIGAWRQLEQTTKVAFWPLLMRLLHQQCSPNDYREVIRVGLIYGSNMSEAEALNLVQAHFDTVPLGTHLPLAVQIMSTAAYGDPELKKD